VKEEIQVGKRRPVEIGKKESLKKKKAPYVELLGEWRAIVRRDELIRHQNKKQRKKNREGWKRQKRHKQAQLKIKTSPRRDKREHDRCNDSKTRAFRPWKAGWKGSKSKFWQENPNESKELTRQSQSQKEELNGQFREGRDEFNGKKWGELKKLTVYVD